MIIAGIDEAGYGPLLGPLVVGCCAFELADEADLARPPCLWKRLSRLAGKSRSRTGRRLHINDSKAVYSPSLGLKELERSILAFAAALGDLPADLAAFLARFCARDLAELARHPWYAPADGEQFPVEVEAASARLFANSLRQEMQASSTQCVHLCARVIPEGEFNRMLQATRNKSTVSFTFVAEHIDHLLRTYAGRGLVLFCDRQGGREHYGHVLRQMFPDWDLVVVAESESSAEYNLIRNQQPVRLVFCEKAETQAMPVALASMLSKYLRETLMRRFNAWWSRHLPGLSPTAGYYTDGQRFLADIAQTRKKLNIADAELVRAR